MHRVGDSGVDVTLHVSVKADFQTNQDDKVLCRRAIVELMSTTPCVSLSITLQSSPEEYNALFR